MAENELTLKSGAGLTSEELGNRCVNLSADNGNLRTENKALREQVQGIRPKRVQPCGCVLCFCEDDVRCSGCGAENCGNPECEVAKGNLIYEQHPYIEALHAALRKYVELGIDFHSFSPWTLLTFVGDEKLQAAEATTKALLEGE